MLGLISGKRKARTEIHAHFPAPVESVTDRRREVDAGASVDIHTQSQITERSEFTQLQINSPLHEYWCDPVHTTSATLEADAGADKEHGINLITVRSGESGIKGCVTFCLNVSIDIESCESVRAQTAAPLKESTVTTAGLTGLRHKGERDDYEQNEYCLFHCNE